MLQRCCYCCRQTPPTSVRLIIIPDRGFWLDSSCVPHCREGRRNPCNRCWWALFWKFFSHAVCRAIVNREENRFYVCPPALAQYLTKTCTNAPCDEPRAGRAAREKESERVSHFPVALREWAISLKQRLFLGYVFIGRWLAVCFMLVFAMKNGHTNTPNSQVGAQFWV